MRLAVFDIDGTLVRGMSTEKRFALHLARTGRIGPRQALAFLGFLPRYWPAYRAHVLKKDKAYLSGMSQSDLARRAAAWAPQALDKAWFEPCVDRLRRHQEAGDLVLLLSGTPQFVAAAVATLLGVEHVAGTRCASRNDRLLASPPASHPFGEEKAVAVREFAAAHRVDAADIVAYGDSIHDLPLFRSVGRAVAVRPDEALAAAAAAQGWEVLGPVRRGLTSWLRPAPRAAMGADLADRH